jgi:membrane-associated protease RseP (regulator of RpoE activity)
MGYTSLGPPSSGSPQKGDGRQEYSQEYEVARRKGSYVLHVGLFLLTFISTMMAGASWAGKDFLEITNWIYGFQYAMLIMTFIGAHEFGHYFAAKWHDVDATLPYFIPMPPFIMPFGTAGALIRTRTAIMTRKALFDIGVAGPLAGFVVCIVFLIVGFATLPPKDFLYAIHPEYRLFGGAIPDWGLHFGGTLLYSLLANIFTNPNGYLPPMNEMYHYPFLCVGWFGLFVTSMNLLPIGQLDGGHIAHAMFSHTQARIGRVAWWIIAVLGLGSLLSYVHGKIMFDSPDTIYTFFQSVLLPPLNVLHSLVPAYYQAWSGWVFWALILRFLIRIEHPHVDDPEPLGIKRMVVGWLAVAILVGSFCITGIYEVERTDSNAVPGEKRPTSGDMIYADPHGFGTTLRIPNQQ